MWNNKDEQKKIKISMVVEKSLSSQRSQSTKHHENLRSNQKVKQSRLLLFDARKRA